MSPDRRWQLTELWLAGWNLYGARSGALVWVERAVEVVASGVIDDYHRVELGL